jgi:GT2 family glycosyltransferase
MASLPRHEDRANSAAKDTLDEFAALETRYYEETLELLDELEASRSEAREWRQQFLLNYSFVYSLFRSPLWKALRWVRGLRRCALPRGFGASALQPWCELVENSQAGPGSWIATRSDAYFVVPIVLPSGWLHVELKMHSSTPGQAAFYADRGEGPNDLECILHIEVNGTVDWQGLVYVSMPALGVRFEPLNAAGRFHIERLGVTPVPPAQAILRGLREKTATAHRLSLLPRTLLRGLGMLLRRNVRQLREGIQELEGKERLLRVALEPVRPPAADGEYPDLLLPAEPEVDLSVVIPTIGKVEWVARSIQSCRLHLPRDRSCEFLVVDDGTHLPGDLDALKRAADDLEFHLLLNHQNLGFSATVNHGMRQTRGRIIVLCNNDIEFFQSWLEPLEAAFAAEPELGIIGAKLLYPNGTIQHAGMDKLPGHLRWQHFFGAWPGSHPKVNRPRHVWSVTGALLAVKRDVLRRLGGFSTAYATAYEDLDYCLHAWSNSVRVGYRPEVAAYHREGATRGLGPTQRAGKPLWWTERERAGAAYFQKKWAALRYVESFEQLRVTSSAAMPTHDQSLSV